MTETISSAANPLVKRMRLLADRRHRRREGAFVVEGNQPVWRAIEAGWEVETLVVAPELLGGPAAELVAEQESLGTRVARLSAELFTRVSDRDGPSGLAAILRGAVAGPETLAVGPQSLFVALHEIGNPGNLGTVIRTADAVGASGVVLVGEGNPGRLRGLIAQEKKRVARVAHEIPIYDLQAGNAEGQVPVSKLQRELMKLPRNLSRAEVSGLRSRLKALPPAVQMPKGPLPKGAKMPKMPRPPR